MQRACQAELVPGRMSGTAWATVLDGKKGGRGKRPLSPEFYWAGLQGAACVCQSTFAWGCMDPLLSVSQCVCTYMYPSACCESTGLWHTCMPVYKANIHGHMHVLSPHMFIYAEATYVIRPCTSILEGYYERGYGKG